MTDWRVPGFTSTGSKRPDALFGAGDDAGLPSRMTRAAGARVWDDAGREYLDYVMALGAVALEDVVALLFGREDKGLSNEALDRCNRIVTIPASLDYPSLNLGHAVVVMLYELALARGADDRPFKPPRRPADRATMAELERLFIDAEQALGAIEFFKVRDREHIMRTVREIVHRVPLDQREAKLLRAMAIEVVKYRERLARSGIHVDRE